MPAGWFRDAAEIDDDLREWDYGIYEGRTTLEIRQETPDWSVWLSPIVNGESLEQVADRAHRVICRVTAAADGDVALFSHGHMLRILATCWIGLPPVTARLLALDTASISVLGYERRLSHPPLERRLSHHPTAGFRQCPRGIDQRNLLSAANRQ